MKKTTTDEPQKPARLYGLTDADIQAMKMLSEEFDPVWHCAEPGCNRATAFKMHWAFIANDWSFFHSFHGSRDQALQIWWSQEKWYCSKHDQTSP